MVTWFKSVAAKYENQVHTIRLPPVEDFVALDTYLELIKEDLKCCENLLGTSTVASCMKCKDYHVEAKQSTTPTLKRRGILIYLLDYATPR